MSWGHQTLNWSQPSQRRSGGKSGGPVQSLEIPAGIPVDRNWHRFGFGEPDYSGRHQNCLQSCGSVKTEMVLAGNPADWF